MGIYPKLAMNQSAPQNGDKPVLLIVDDEAGPRESLRMVFKDRYQCAIATSGRDGIAYARDHRVDAAILDIRMPDLSGVDVLREIKQIDPHIECVMLTGYETIETARAAVRHGAADYLNKPFDVFAMRELLDKCLARRRQKLEMEENLRSLSHLNDELARELAERERGAAASVLSAGVVHELNNPLAIVAAYAQLLSRDLSRLHDGDAAAAQEMQQRLAGIQREVARCKDIAQRFLRFARAERRETERVEAAQLLADAAMLVRAHPGNRAATLAVNANGASLPVNVHPGEIMQVFLNLGINALQATNGDGTLTFTADTGPIPADCAYRAASCNPQQPHVRLAVTDNGPGIAPENLAKLFTRNFTTKTNGNGLGLGIVAELVGRHHGAIAVASATGKGTTFSVYLPLAG